MTKEKIEKLVAIYMEVTLLSTIVMLVVFIITTIRFNAFEKSINIDNINSYEGEYIPVEEIMRRKIMVMPMPKKQTEKNKKTTEKEISVKEIIEESIADTDIEKEKRDVEILAQVMYAEEGILLTKNLVSYEDAKRAHMLCGSVIIHRANSKGYPNTIEGVIRQPKQYDCVTRGMLNQEVPQVVYEWAEELLENGPIGPEDLIYQSEFMQGSKEEPYELIYNQYFCTK